MRDSYYIEEIITEIEKKLNWKKIALWTDSDYKKLSQLILIDTNISISPQTLKRLFGKVKYKERYTPQPATKDALAMFLGYGDWQGFLDSKDQNNHFMRIIYSGLKNLSPFRIKIAVAVIAVLVLIIVAIRLIHSVPDNLIFYATSLSGAVPHTVSIHYDISKLPSGNIYIDFDEHEAEDSSLREKLDKNRHLINHCFESPGFYNVRLYLDGKIRQSVKVHVLSDGWASYYFNNDNFLQRKFIFGLEHKVKNNMQIDSMLYITPNTLMEQGFNGNTVYYLEHLLYKDFQLSGDDFKFEIKYKNGPETGGISCYDVEFRIIGEKGMISVMLVQKGCYRWSEVIFGEVHQNGKFNNLTKLSSDLASWNNIKIESNGGKGLIFNGQDTIFTCYYQQAIGNIKGCRLVTKGSGAFREFRLSDTKGVKKYSDTFSR